MLDIKLSPAEANLDNEPADVVIHDRDGNAYEDDQGNPTVFLVLGEYSDKVRAYDRAQTNKHLKKRGRDDSVDADVLDSGLVDRLAAAVVGWKNVVAEGKPEPFTSEGVKQILRAMPWTRNDVAKGMLSHSDFFAKRSGS
jgi:hypothetical protein